MTRERLAYKPFWPELVERKAPRLGYCAACRRTVVLSGHGASQTHRAATRPIQSDKGMESEWQLARAARRRAVRDDDADAVAAGWRRTATGWRTPEGMTYDA